jgi:ferredoxin
MSAIVNRETCTGCGKCVEVCDFGAITIDNDGIASADKEECAHCFACADNCPSEAIGFERKD